jgi:hypothetical protein
MKADELWNALILEGKHDVIEMLQKAEKGEMKGKTIKVKKNHYVFATNGDTEKAVRQFLELSGVTLEEID